MQEKIFDPWNLPDTVCEHLYNKQRLCVAGERDPALYAPGDEDPGASYWCGKTQVAQGPDGEIVDPEFCSPPRSCCIPRKVPRPQA